MIYLIGIWLLLLLISSVIGIGLLYPLSDITRLRRGDRLILALWSGVIALAVALLVVSLQWALTPWIGLLLAIGLMGIASGSAAPRQAWKSLWVGLTRQQIGLGLASLGFTAAIMSRLVVWHDAGYYHTSVLRWLSQYGTVPGLALIFTNLGFTSSWFSLVAPLSLPHLVAKTSAVGNGFAAWLLVMHWVIVAARVLRRRAQVSDWYMLLYGLGAMVASLLLPPFREIMVSPSPDFPILVLVGTIGWAMLLVASLEAAPGSQSSRLAIVPFGLAIGAVTIKLTAIPVALVTGLFFILSQRLSLGRIAFGLGVGGLLMAPNLAASIRTSGCPLFPSAVLCVDVPWAPTRQAAYQIAANTHDWTSWLGPPPVGVNPWWWAFTQLIQTPLDLITFAIVGMALLASLVVAYSALRKFSLRRLPGELWVILMGIVGIGFLFLTSIFTRFLFPHMLSLLSLSGAWVLQRQAWGRQLRSVLRQVPIWAPYLRLRGLYLGMTLLATAGMTASLLLYRGANALLPPPMPESPMVQRQTNQIVYASPKSGDLQITLENSGKYQTSDLDRCWATPIPCAYNVPADVYLRDPAVGLAAGFERRPLSQQP